MKKKSMVCLWVPQEETRGYNKIYRITKTEMGSPCNENGEYKNCQKDNRMDAICEGRTKRHKQQLFFVKQHALLLTNQIHHLNVQTFCLFFHIITTSLYTFLPAFREFEYSPYVKFRSNHSKTLTHCLLNCFRCLITLSAQLILHKYEKMVVGGRQIRVIGGGWKKLPPHLRNCFRCEASALGEVGERRHAE